jgi:glycerol-3-phosphate dehydrogenase
VLSSRGSREVVTARVLVNAAGPWIAEVMERVLRLAGPLRVRFVKGSHILVRRLFEHDRAYLLPGVDGRVVFAIPWERDFTLIGTTQRRHDGHPGALAADADEITYLCRAASAYFREPVEPREVVWAFAGVRPVYGDAARKNVVEPGAHLLTLDAPPRQAPLLTIHGGRITTYRRLAEMVLAQLSRHVGMAPPWSNRVPLPGGDFPWDGIEALVLRARGLWPFLGDGHARRLVAAYGTRLERVLGQATSFEDLGPRFGAELTAAEVRYLMRHEWAETADDVLWRRSKLGLRIGPDGQAALAAFMADTTGHSAAAE